MIAVAQIVNSQAVLGNAVKAKGEVENVFLSVRTEEMYVANATANPVTGMH